MKRNRYTYSFRDKSGIKEDERLKNTRTFDMFTCSDSCPSRKLVLGGVGFGDRSVSDFPD